MKFTVVVLALAWVVLASTHAHAEPAFTGVNGCRCHKPEIDDWLKSGHANAITKLTPAGRSKHDRHAMENAKLDPAKDYSSDTKCLPCHTTGSLESGGYESA
ncbi:MAG: hypothetical protein HY804_12250 [Nitrospinae bacterium]|nr:hypothetical protein [Nitrospinota bacterium]